MHQHTFLEEVMRSGTLMQKLDHVPFSVETGPINTELFDNRYSHVPAVDGAMSTHHRASWKSQKAGSPACMHGIHVSGMNSVVKHQRVCEHESEACVAADVPKEPHRKVRQVHAPHAFALEAPRRQQCTRSLEELVRV